MTPESEAPLPVESGRRTHPLSGLLKGLFWGAALSAGFAWQTFEIDALLRSVWLVGVGFLVGLVAGYASWFRWRFIIDSAEVRIESGILFRSSKRMPYARIQSVDINQPFLARIVGLAELSIEVAGGSDSAAKVQFVTLDEARTLRRQILRRVHGQSDPTAPDGPGTDGVPDDDADLELRRRFDGTFEEPQEQLLRVPPGWLVLGTVVSLDFLLTLLVALAGLAVPLFIHERWIVASVAVPALWGTGLIIANRVIPQWDFTLSRTSRGLRIERGLLSRSSQTIPFDRVQGIRQTSPLLWRQLGWVRLDIDVAGYGVVSADSSGLSTTTLLPIGTRAAGEWIEGLLIADPSFDSRTTVAVTRRSRLFAPIGWKRRAYATSDDVVRTSTGWVKRTLTAVPHHKVQSVSISQGPLLRRRGVATLQVHTPDGPVNSEVRHLDEDDARRELDLEVTRVVDLLR